MATCTYYTTKKIGDRIIPKNHKTVFYKIQDGVGTWVQKEKPKIGTSVYIYSGELTREGLERRPHQLWDSEAVLRSINRGSPDIQRTTKGLPKVKIPELSVQAYMTDLKVQLAKVRAILDSEQFEEIKENLDSSIKRQLLKFKEHFESALPELASALGGRAEVPKVPRKLDYLASIKNTWDNLHRIIGQEEKWISLENYLTPSKQESLYKGYKGLLKADEWVEKNPIFGKGQEQSISQNEKVFREVLKKVNFIRKSTSKLKLKSKIETVSDTVLDWQINGGNKEVVIYNKGPRPTAIKLANIIKRTKFSPVIFCVNEIGTGPWSPKDKLPENVLKEMGKLFKDAKNIQVTTFSINRPGGNTIWIKDGDESELNLAHEAFNIITQIREAEDTNNQDRNRLQGQVKLWYKRLAEINKQL